MARGADARVRGGRAARPGALLPGMGLHSFTSQLNLRAFCGIGGARLDCVACVKGVFTVCRVFLCVFVCQTRLKLSCNVNECKPLVPGAAGGRGRDRAGRRGGGQGLTLAHISAQREHILWDTLGA